MDTVQFTTENLRCGDRLQNLIAGIQAKNDMKKCMDSMLGVHTCNEQHHNLLVSPLELHS